MYRKQMTLQKVLCILCIITCVLVFIYALGFMTGIYDMITPLDEKDKSPEIRQLMTDMNSFDEDLVKIGIGLILISLTLLLTNTHSRRKYYISNYVVTGAVAAAACAASFVVHQRVSELKDRFFSGIIDFEYVKKALDPYPGRRQPKGVFTDSPFWFDLHYYLFGMLLLIAVLLIMNAIWKGVLMKSERSALSADKGV